MDIKKKSPSLLKIEKYRKSVLSELYFQCTIPQREIFNEMYGSLHDIPINKIDSLVLVDRFTTCSSRLCFGPKSCE